MTTARQLRIAQLHQELARIHGELARIHEAGEAAEDEAPAAPKPKRRYRDKDALRKAIAERVTEMTRNDAG